MERGQKGRFDENPQNYFYNAMCGNENEEELWLLTICQISKPERREHSL